MKQLTKDKFIAEGVKRFGENRIKWRVVCPSCGTEQSAEDAMKAGASEAEAKNALGFNCIGRITDKKIGCDWSLGGLLKIHKLEVIEDGKAHPMFELAETNKSTDK